MAGVLVFALTILVGALLYARAHIEETWLMDFVLNETKYNSPNYTPAALVPAVYGMERKITGVTIHHWGVDGQSIDGISSYLCRAGGNTSAHFSLQDGLVYCLVSPADAAWHAGSAEGNATTIGIECRPEMTDGDLDTLVQLIRWLQGQYGDLKIYRHMDWFNTACPGRYAEKIDWIVDQVNKKDDPNKGDWLKMATQHDVEVALNKVIHENKGFFHQVVNEVLNNELHNYLYERALAGSRAALHEEFDKQGTIGGKPATGKTSVATEAAWADANFRSVHDKPGS